MKTLREQVSQIGTDTYDSKLRSAYMHFENLHSILQKSQLSHL